MDSWLALRACVMRLLSRLTKTRMATSGRKANTVMTGSIRTSVMNAIEKTST